MSNNWKNKILNHEETPPAGVWESIASKLDNDKWQERILTHEEAPPEGMWAKIAAGIDDDKKEAIVIPIEKKKGNLIFWRIAAAACVASLIVVYIFVLNKKSNPEVAVVEKNTAIKKEEPVVVKDTLSKITAPILAPQNETIAAVTTPKLDIVKKRPAHTTPSAKEEVDLNIGFINGNEVLPNLASDPSKIKSEKLNNADGQDVNDIAYMNPPNSYITITGPNGETIKVSSKFSKMIHSITERNPDTEEYIDKVIKESKFWKGKFKSWRDKMTNNTLAPAPTNFMDIIELSKLVKE